MINKFVNKIYNEDCLETMSRIDDNSIDLIITSPPYNVGKEYEIKTNTKKYIKWLYLIWKECYRILKSDGRIAINVADTGRNPYIPLHSIISINLSEIGFIHRGLIVWDKGASAGKKTSWGSWKSASNPCLRDIQEYIIVAHKEKPKKERRGESTISKEEFLQNTEAIWKFNTESSKRIGHPAPFPLELPKRLVQLYTYAEDIVYDPFIGSGTTAVAAKMLNRRYIGTEVFKEYCDIAEKRLKELDNDRTK